ncbi:hypothetical protein PUNSTDRAFT_140670 [Punctularia strigosozonata HHB-11173 SS5]|uniref:uncharacterized protein n=1 Tax=Punctularia strigosozonata (strain HHB-11173) TaxID=741275 RepID=UPI000441757D|nr:uncharacterized protein PUNSTDRAFT_140670 [Punctularia strigosozonata HHB-11173 SS5]EIN14362.1 hypothetical protein PUNSTDRAFT_140670 [Punctularia strigosozonata HHB-11173 SS5]
MPKPSKKGLKAALISQQSRLKKNQKAERSRKAAEQKNISIGRQKAKGKGKAHPPRVTVPFSPTDRILLVGEGNFSFTRALALHTPVTYSEPSSSSDPLNYLPPGNITATAYDSEEDCYNKYTDAKEIVAGLRQAGVEVLFGVDATRLEKASKLRGRQYDRIVWNFPHAGSGISDQDRNILSNQLLILGFLRSASAFLRPGPVPLSPTARKKQKTSEDSDDEGDIEPIGEEGTQQRTAGYRGTLLITLRNVTPYTLWDVPKLAKHPPASAPDNPQYTQVRSFLFHRSAWKGYEHRMTKGERANGAGTTGQGGEDRTWEFCLAA